MARPQYDVCQWNYENPHATKALHIPVVMLRNTPDAKIVENVKTNSAKSLPWLVADKAHDGEAVIVGGGPSVEECVDDIRRLVGHGTEFEIRAVPETTRLPTPSCKPRPFHRSVRHDHHAIRCESERQVLSAYR